MFSHVTLGTHDIRRAVAFYDALLAGLGLARQEGDMDKGYAGYAAAHGASPQFWVMVPIDGRPASSAAPAIARNSGGAAPRRGGDA